MCSSGFPKPHVVGSEDDLGWKKSGFGSCLLQPPAQSMADFSVKLNNVCDRKWVRLILEAAYDKVFT